MAGTLFRFSCVNGQCVYDPNGPFTDYFQCVAACSAPAPAPSPPPSPSCPAQTLCGKDAVIACLTRRLQTNLWGVAPNESIPLYSNCVFLNGDGTFGWKWNRPNPLPNPGQQYAWPVYPDITTGTSPWGGYASNPALPVKISDIRSLEFALKYMYAIPPGRNDSLNLAYDIWVMDKPVPDREALDTKKEIMIWINKQNVPMPSGPSVSDGTNTYTLATWTNYNAFMLGVLPGIGNKSHHVDVKALIDYLVQQGLIPSNWYLAEIALGNEVWQSRGQMNISSLVYTLNGAYI